jgi:hypothetical protein
MDTSLEGEISTKETTDHNHLATSSAPTTMERRDCDETEMESMRKSRTRSVSLEELYVTATESQSESDNSSVFGDSKFEELEDIIPETASESRGKLETVKIQVGDPSFQESSIETKLHSEREKTEAETEILEKLKAVEAELAKLKSEKENACAATWEKLVMVERKIEIERSKKTHSATQIMFLKKQQVLKKLIETNQNADVAFLVDCTGSMVKYIDETKKQIQSIVDQIQDTYGNKVRIAFVGYRDHCDKEKRIESLDFTEDVEVFKEFVKNITATGGGDGPEDVLGGLESAFNLTWLHQNKIILHVGDAPQHGGRFHDWGPSYDDHYYVEPRGLKVEDLFDNLKQLKVQYFFGKINSSTDKMMKEFKKLGGENVREDNMSNPSLLNRMAVGSISATISATVSRTIHEDFFSLDKSTSHLRKSIMPRALKSYTIIEVEPEESDMEPESKVQEMRCEIPRLDPSWKIEDCVKNITHKWTTSMIKRTSDPFAQGEQRLSFHGRRMNYSEGGRHDPIILKEFKHMGSGRDRQGDYIEIMETQMVAAFLAKAFNKVSPRKVKKIDFLSVSVAVITKDDGAPRYYNVEPLLHDYKAKFKKWNNNCGFVIAKNSPTLDAFSHWTHDITDGFLMVVDLQGVERDDGYKLTDPSINCKEPMFGKTNLGDVGIDQFFKSHQCGETCKTMKLKPKKQGWRSYFSL